jgi:hypothetical protein
MGGKFLHGGGVEEREGKVRLRTTMRVLVKEVSADLIPTAPTPIVPVVMRVVVVGKGATSISALVRVLKTRVRPFFLRIVSRK